ncbi:MAG: serine hydrolase domain-containing protein [Steroidobacteraceae bacterium]
MSNTWSLLLAVLLCIAVSVGRAAEDLSPRQIEEIQSLGRAVLAKDALPGLSIGVAKGGRTWSFGFGSADLENDVPVDARSMFRTASILKWMTATAALRLVEAGKLNLDAQVQDYCPQYPKKQWPITVRHLLIHQSGIRHYHGANGEPRETEEQRRALDRLIQSEQSRQHTRYTDVIAPLDAFKDDALIFRPGARFHYTSAGYRLLGCVLEGAAKVPYRTLMRELVFNPAGMATITEDDARTIVKHRVAGYSKESGLLVRAQFRDVSENLPAGGHLATVRDLVRFAAAFNSDKLVQPATRAAMLERPRLSDGSSAPFAPPYFGVGRETYYGMGVFVGSMNGEQLVMHSGGQAGTSTELLLAPQSDVAVAVMTNVNGWRDTHAVATEVLKLVRED